MFSELVYWLIDLSHAFLRTALRGVGFILSSPGLALLATIAAAVATWFSYLAADRSVDVAQAAQKFAEQNYADQMALTRPSVAVLGGKASHVYTRQLSWMENHTVDIYRIELRLRNSGARSARPVWISLSPGFAKGTLTTVLDELPRDVDVSITFDVESKLSADDYWYVGVGFGDLVPASTVPGVKSAAPPGVAPALTRVCHVQNVMQLDIRPERENPHDKSSATALLISPGIPRPSAIEAHGTGFTSITTSAQDSVRERTVSDQRSSTFCDAMSS